MKVRVLKRFRDIREKIIREAGEVFECTEERYQEILGKGDYVTAAGETGEEKPKRKTRSKVKEGDL